MPTAAAILAIAKEMARTAADYLTDKVMSPKIDPNSPDQRQREWMDYGRFKMVDPTIRPNPRPSDDKPGNGVRG